MKTGTSADHDQCELVYIFRCKKAQNMQQGQNATTKNATFWCRNKGSETQKRLLYDHY